MVWTDSSQQKMQRFLSTDSTPEDSQSKDWNEENSSEQTMDQNSSPKNPTWREIRITSVLQLQQMIKDNCHAGLRGVFHDHSFVGCISPGMALIQHHTNLYLCNTWRLALQLFYQTMMFQFGNLRMINFSQPLSIAELAMMGLKSEDSGWTETDGAKQKLADYFASILVSKSDMLGDFFSIRIDEAAMLHGVPILLDGVFPSFEYLPMWILRLATEVKWEDEQGCFMTLCQETSKLYAHCFNDFSLDDQDSDNDDESGDPDLRNKEKDSSSLQEIIDSQSSEAGPSTAVQIWKNVKKQESKKKQWELTVEHNIYGAFRKTLLPPKHFAKDGSVVQMAKFSTFVQGF